LAAVTTTPQGDVEDVMRQLKIDRLFLPHLILAAAQSAYKNGEISLAAQLLARTLESFGKAKLPSQWRLGAALLAIQLGEIEAAKRVYHKIEPPSLTDAEGTFGEDPIKATASDIIAHASLAALLGERASAETEPEHQTLRALQRHLATMGRLTGEARDGRRSAAHLVAREVRKILLFLNQLTSGSAGDFHPVQQARYSAPILGGAMVEAAEAHGPSAFSAVMAELDAVTSNAKHLVYQWPEFRRQVLLRAYEHDRDQNAAAARIEAIAESRIDAGTPDEQVEEITKNARAFALIGLGSRARALLASVHQHTLGYALAPKKDPQYIFWRDILVRASDADPSRRCERIEFMTRLITGMARTEGRDTAYRLTCTLLEQAAIVGPDLA
jgi:hypothetical protein